MNLTKIKNNFLKFKEIAIMKLKLLYANLFYF